MNLKFLGLALLLMVLGLLVGPSWAQPPDRDGDTVPDDRDACPDQAPTVPLEERYLYGCDEQISLTLAPNRAIITAENAAALESLGQLVLEGATFDLANGGLVIGADTGLYRYDLSVDDLAPVSGFSAEVPNEGDAIALRDDGAVVVTQEFAEDFSTVFAVPRDGQTAQPLHAPYTLAGETFAVGPLAFAPDSPWLAVGPQTQRDDSAPYASVWDTDTHSELYQIAVPSSVRYIAFSSDGTTLAMDYDDLANSSMAIGLWDVETGQALATIPTYDMRHFQGNPMDFHPTAPQLAFGAPDGSVTVWNLTDQAPTYQVQPFTETDEVVSAIAYSPDGRLLAVAGGVPYSGFGGGSSGEPIEFPIFAVVILDAATGAELVRLDDFVALPRQVAFASRGDLLVVNSLAISFWGLPQ